jgi:uncharacterized LabA/DUF88 family protein
VSKNVAVFVDVANIFYAAKAAGVDIDYVTLLKAASAGRDLVRAYAYTGLDPDNENQRNFHDFLRRSNYKVVSKDIRKYGDGKVKANLDIELVVDMMKTARNLDIAIVVSGDGDFAPAIRAVQEQGVRVEVISFRGNTSSDLIEVADQFTDIVQLARVEKGTRSGRRVADDDADLSMTEVPDKQTEGTGVGRSRGRGRGRGREAEPVAATGRGRARLRTEGAAPAGAVAARGDAATLVALPGERLARAAGPLTDAELAQAEVFTLDELDDVATDAAAAAEGDVRGTTEDGDEPRRRRRRGGRGRGRGRGQSEEGQIEGADAPEAAETAAAGRAPASRRPAPPAPLAADGEDVDEDEELAVAAPRSPRTTPFGSVWDSQIGTPSSASGAPRAPLVDEEDFEEPEIPEYLIAEQRRSGNRGGAPGRAGGGARGGRSAYQSAMDRERYGRGSGGGGGINRYPDVSGRTRPAAPQRDDRNYSRGGDRPAPAPAPAGRSSNEPWSDVPPELEALLRAQVAQKPPAGRSSGSGRTSASDTSGVTSEAAPIETSEPVAKAAAKPRATRKASATSGAAKPAAKPRATRKTSASGAASAGVAEPGLTAGSTDGAASEPAVKAPAKPRATRKPAAAKAAPASASATGDGAEAAPKRRTTRKTTAPTKPV